jgi:hypothetical protein
LAGSNAVYAFYAGCDECGAYAVQACWNGYGAECPVVFRMQVDFYSADSSCFLKFPKIKLRPEKSFCLSENCSNDIWFFNDAFDIKLGVYNILYSKRLGCSRKC